MGWGRLTRCWFSCLAPLTLNHLLLICRRSKEESDGLERVEKVVVFGGGSFGTAMGVSLARQNKVGQASFGGWCAVHVML